MSKETLTSTETTVNLQYLQSLRDYVNSRLQKMQDSGYNPVLLAPTLDNQEYCVNRMSRWVAELIRSVYGDAFPLPNKDPKFNEAQIRAGNYHPFFGGFVRDREFFPVMTAGLCVVGKNQVELGRTAKTPSESGFLGGALSLQRIVKVLENPHLFPNVDTMITQIRVSSAHDALPSSDPVQSLLLGKAKFAPTYLAPLYDVGGDNSHEWFLELSKARFEENRAKQHTVVVVEGPHLALLEQLMLAQVGTKDLETHNPEKRYGGGFVLTPSQFKSVYGEVRPSAFGSQNLATQELDTLAPTWLCKIRATQETLAVQQAMLDAGFQICGVNVSSKEEPVLYLTRRGYKPADAMAQLGLLKSENLYSSELAKELESLVLRLTN